ncbi:MAG TPA: hypothetical protein DDW50_08840, partial [Firmicutes bacterium]|nr:hypothetical protein [Bacillota bacterium]
MKKLFFIGLLTCFVVFMNPIHLLAMEGGAVLTNSGHNGTSAFHGQTLNQFVLLADQNTTTYNTTKLDPKKAQPASGKTSSFVEESNHNKSRIENILLFIGSWWVANPLNLQIWYIFCFVGLLFYLLKLKHFRQPLLFLSIIILGFYLGSSLDPISAIFNLIPNTKFTFDGAMIILGIMALLSMVLGRFYCGWICPLGAIQELIYPKTKIKMSLAPDSVLKYLKYLILVVFLYVAWRTGDNVWEHYGPLKVLVHFDGSELAFFFLV